MIDPDLPLRDAVVLGAGGLLGRHLIEELAARGVPTRAYDRARCPIDAPAQVAAAVRAASHVFNCAAWTDVDGAERQVDAANRANALGAELVARAAAATGAVVVHVSTDFVFDGLLARAYDEFDAPNPQSIYARSKRAGELLVAQVARHHVVRVQGLYGRGGKNFASRLPDLLRSGKPLTIDGERRVQPTSARAAARALLAIGESSHFGTWHASCSGETTWVGFTARLAERLGLPVTWTAVGSSALRLPAPRPPNCTLEQRRIQLYGLAPLPPWEAAQDGFLDEL